MLRLVQFLVAGVLAVAPAYAQDPPDPPAPPALTQESIAELSLDDLFIRLQKDGKGRDGRLVEAEILKRFHHSGSDTVDLLLSWGMQAMEEKEYPLALDVFDQVILLKPDFAEGWNKRATVYFLMDEYGASVADIRQTLALEPRHFGALAGFGMILRDIGKKGEALTVFRKAIAINPRLDNIAEAIEELEKETAGSEI
jgi:tetratricopeptide (TPR) repeat protein